MVTAGPNLSQTAKTPKGGSPIHFLRILRYARAYRRYLYPAIVCVVIVAATYSTNIVALLPAIHVIQSDRGVPAWVHNWVAEERLGAVINEKGEIQSIDEGRPLLDAYEKDVEGSPEGAPKSHHKAANSPLNRATIKTLGDPPKDISPDEFFRTVARASGSDTLSVGVSIPGRDDTVRLAVKPRHNTWKYRAAVWSASWLPQRMDYHARMTSLIIIVTFVMVIALIGAICRFTGEYLIALTAARTVVGIRRQMYRKVLRLPLSQFNNTSDITSRFVQDSQDIYRGLNFVFAKSLREPLKAAFVFSAALIIDWRITLVTVISAPFAALVIRKLGKTIRRSNKKLLLGYSKMITALEGALIGIRVVKGYTMESYERRHLFAVDLHMLKQELKIARIEAMSSPVFETIGRLVASFVMIYFASQMFSGEMNFATFGTLAACMAAMFDPIRQMSGFYNRMQRANAAADRCFELLDRPMEEEGRPISAAAPLPAFRDSVEFRDVSYTYPGAERPALDGIDLKVQRGERVALVGPNGSGKTTLLSILMRFFEPETGAVLVDGRDVREFALASLRKQISLVTQDTVMFADTIAANIAYGDEDILRRMMLQRRHPDRNYHVEADRERIVAAAKAAHCDEFITEKPEGYDTIVGEHGTTLSGGQKQRIAIARAMLRNAPIFIFDEATSQVDSESEQKIHDAVEQFLRDRTAFIIAHRLSTILQADRIVVMDRGRIIDGGTHEELARRCPLYRTLYGNAIVEDVGRTVTTSAAGTVRTAPTTIQR